VELQSSVAFVDREDFVAAIAASDLVACPYDQASQSGVLALANQLGVPTVSTDIGGLAELATASIPVGDPQRLTEVIDEVLQSSQREAPRGGREEELLHMHRRAYGMC
jgi:glycosyltransferase involved in cell wall biosynthesis